MIPPSVPNALLLGLWVAEERAAITASLRDEYGNTTSDVLALTGEPWTVVVQALECAELMDVQYVVLLSNDLGLVSALSPPFAAPPADRKERVWFSRTDWADIPSGGNPDHWQALRLIGGRWGGRFRAMCVSDLPKARELWQQEQQSKHKHQ